MSKSTRQHLDGQNHLPVTKVTKSQGRVKPAVQSCQSWGTILTYMSVCTCFVSHEPALKLKPKQTKFKFEHLRLISLGSPWRSAWATRWTGWRSPPDGSPSASAISRLETKGGGKSHHSFLGDFLGKKNWPQYFVIEFFKNLFYMYQQHSLIKLPF